MTVDAGGVGNEAVNPAGSCAVGGLMVDGAAGGRDVGNVAVKPLGSCTGGGVTVEGAAGWRDV